MHTHTMMIPTFIPHYELALLYLQNDKSVFPNYQLDLLMKFAIEVRWINLIITLYQDRIGVFMLNDKNETLLFSAIRNNYKIFVQIAIENNYDLNGINTDGDTLLHVCIKSNKLDIAELLLINHINYNVTNKEGLTPLLLMESGIIPSTSPNFYHILNILYVNVYKLSF